MTMVFRFVQYGNAEYPKEITPELIELAGHLDKDRIEDVPKYSLHTEYGYCNIAEGTGECGSGKGSAIQTDDNQDNSNE